ncbi:hypothetical protein GQ43DRAFT_458101 [Delitschia confertaspora ATCC 74209]|uniref:NACHT domain-containing protein n=1 Tax=Delitschia confertaspora ATCC 74209 TaxID=1513339 RepID=A0A9P4JER4_9PLEO|nr:hypothetical protein GQ43DRAFT_458101 [Delitschia confertaspora ATCC 74209]
MSLVQNVGRLKPEIRLAQAVSAFEADLTSQQKASFRTYKSQSRDSPPDLTDAMRLTAEIDRNASGRRCVGPRLTNFLEAVQQYAALGDVIVGGSQNIVACGVWSLVRISLQMIANYSSYIEKLSLLLMTVGRSAPRYRTVALLYPQSRNLQSYLSEYFIVVVRLCHKLLNFTQKSTFGQVTSSLKEVNLQMAKRIEEEARENWQFRTLSAKLSKSTSLQQKLATKLRVLDSCSKYDYDTAWKQIRKAGKATLLQSNTKYQDWKNRPGSCTLIYTGKLGSGKSILLANIVDDIHLHVDKSKATVAYFFCRYDIPESMKAQTVIGSLARQLLRPLVDLTKTAELLDTSLAPAPDFETLMSLLDCVLPPTYRAYFVLDGLDEWDPPEKDVLIKQLQVLQSFVSINLCVSLRLDNTLISETKRFTGPSVTSIPADNPDIRTYIEEELENHLETRKLVVGNPSIILEIRDALLNGSQGMFLWVALQIQSLCTMRTDEDIRKALSDLPRDLWETFSPILQRSERIGMAYQRPILEFMIAARRPLTTEELREALSVVSGDAIWDLSKLPNDIYSTLTCCGCLLLVDEDELTVRFVHHSVRQFLLKGFNIKQFLFKGFTDAENIPITAVRSTRRMADSIITYLSYNVFETQLSTLVVPKMNAAPLPSRIIESTCGSSNTARRLALSLLKSRKQAEFDIAKTVQEISKRSDNPVTQFHFVNYAKSYWFFHVPFMSEDVPVLRSMLLKLFERKYIEGKTLLSWAAANGLTGVVNVNPEYNDRTPLAVAAELGHTRIVELLLQTGKAAINRKDRDGHIPLGLAVKNGHEEIVELLLDAEKAAGEIRTDLDYRDEDGLSLLWHATTGGFNIHFKHPTSGQSLLGEAAERGHEGVVKTLLDTQQSSTPLFTGGSWVDTTDSKGQTPLLYAVRSRHEAIVKLLLEAGARVDVEDKRGDAPISYVKAAEPEGIINMLLSAQKDMMRKDAKYRSRASTQTLQGDADRLGAKGL